MDENISVKELNIPEGYMPACGLQCFNCRHGDCILPEDWLEQARKKHRREYQRAYQKEYYAKHTQSRKISNRRYYEEHRNELNERRKEYYWEHREEILARKYEKYHTQKV